MVNAPTAERPAGVFFFGRDYHGHMEPADSIRRLGFARWYERRLIEGHAWFGSGFVCIVAIAACMEQLGFHGSIDRLHFYVALGLAAAPIRIYGLVGQQQILSTT